MIKEAIVLAGGLGTRLRSVVNELPKCMAPVAGQPFLHWVIEYYKEQGIDRFIFSLGYKHEAITQYLDENYPALEKVYSIEKEPLGTGGAIQLASMQARDKHVLILNGDTLFAVNIAQLSHFHQGLSADCTLSLKRMFNFDRYGVVETDEKKQVSSFAEKKAYEEGLINGGVYALNLHSFLNKNFEEKFSFEKDYLEPCVATDKFYGIEQKGYFIDIGIPEDYQKANEDFALPQQPWQRATQAKIEVDKSWTLFLDRDGVINEEKHMDYIHKWEEFRFYEGVKEAVGLLSGLFGRIIVVTNQKGVGKGVTLLEDLKLIHSNMTGAFADAGGKIDAVYFSSDLDENSPHRKPNPGMGLQAIKDFPAIDLSRSIMVGNTLSDMKFGRNLGVKYTVFLPTTRPDVALDDAHIDFTYPSLLHFAKSLIV